MCHANVCLSWPVKPYLKTPALKICPSTPVWSQNLRVHKPAYRLNTAMPSVMALFHNPEDADGKAMAKVVVALMSVSGLLIMVGVLIHCCQWGSVIHAWCT